jgi:hypothetical protein
LSIGNGVVCRDFKDLQDDTSEEVSQSPNPYITAGSCPGPGKAGGNISEGSGIFYEADKSLQRV